MGLAFKHYTMEFVKRSAPERSVLELLVCAGLSDAPKAGRLVLKLLGEQKASGAFPNQFDPAIGGVAATISSASLLLDCKLSPGSHPIAGAVGYLLGKQRDDGGWCESRRVKIPEWMTWHSNKASVTHYTAMALRLLDRAGLRHHNSFKKAETWLMPFCVIPAPLGASWGSPPAGGLLPKRAPARAGPRPGERRSAPTRMERGSCKKALRSMQEPDGRFRYHLGASVDRDATTGILFTMRDLFGESDAVFRRGRPRYEEYLSAVAEDARRGRRYFEGEPKDNDIYHLTFLLNEATARAGYGLRDSRARAIVQAIFETQRSDGGWKFWTDEGDPRYSVEALRCLVWVGALAREEVARMLRAHGIV